MRVHIVCCKREKRHYSSTIEEITMNGLLEMCKQDPNTVLLDVRSPQEYKEGHLDGSILIPTYDIKRRALSILKDKHNPIIVYCQGGERSRKVATMLKQMGYVHVYNLKDGIENS